MTGTFSLSPVGCGAPSRPENGSTQSLDISRGTQQGSAIFFGCNASYVPPGNMTSVCASNGMWNPDPATFVCTFDCGIPVAPQRGSVESYTNTTEGSVAFYSCEQNLLPVGRMMSMCTVNGWNLNLSCSVVDCEMPNHPVNGFFRPPQSTLGGSVIEFGCDPGFIPAERMTGICMLSGNWSPDPGTLVCSGKITKCADTCTQ